jgi:hypothetical protein
MTAHSLPTPDHPDELLSTTRDLARRVRAAQRGAWFPLVVFGVLTLGAIVVYRFGHPDLTCRTFAAGAGAGAGRVCAVHSSTALIYWPIALTVAYVAITAFYVRRSRERGIGTPVRPYVVTGVVLAVVLSGASLWAAQHPATSGIGLYTLESRLASPSSAIGLALLVLARVERSWPLLTFTLGYLVVVLVPLTFGWVAPVPWTYLPRLLVAGGVLLVGGIGFALAQRTDRPATP